MHQSSGEGRQSGPEFHEVIDPVQARYGWTDEYILGLPYARLLEVVEVAAKAIAEEKRSRIEEAAFIGYQSYLVQPQMSKKKATKMSFKKWLRLLGIKQPDEDFDRNAELASAYEAAEAVKKVRWRRV